MTDAVQIAITVAAPAMLTAVGVMWQNYLLDRRAGRDRETTRVELVGKVAEVHDAVNGGYGAVKHELDITRQDLLKTQSEMANVAKELKAQLADVLLLRAENAARCAVDGTMTAIPLLLGPSGQGNLPADVTGLPRPLHLDHHSSGC